MNNSNGSKGVLCKPEKACEKHLQYTFIQSYKQTVRNLLVYIFTKKRHPFQNAFNKDLIHYQAFAVSVILITISLLNIRSLIG